MEERGRRPADDMSDMTAELSDMSAGSDMSAVSDMTAELLYGKVLLSDMSQVGLGPTPDYRGMCC